MSVVRNSLTSTSTLMFDDWHISASNIQSRLQVISIDITENNYEVVKAVVGSYLLNKVLPWLANERNGGIDKSNYYQTLL